MFTQVQVGLRLWTRKCRERDGDGPKDAQHVSPSPPWSTSSPTASKRGAGRGARHRCACWEAGLSPGMALFSARTPFLCHWALSPVRSVSWHVGGWREGNPDIRSLDSGPASRTAAGFPFPSRGQSPGRVCIPGQLCRASFPLLFTAGLPRPALTSSQNQEHFTTSVALVSVHTASREEGMWR